MCLHAQHLEFKGHSINGKLENFVALLERDGFVVIGKSDKEPVQK